MKFPCDLGTDLEHDGCILAKTWEFLLFMSTRIDSAETNGTAQQHSGFKKRCRTGSSAFEQNRLSLRLRSSAGVLS